jgi:hypothetical protein
MTDSTSDVDTRTGARAGQTHDGDSRHGETHDGERQVQQHADAVAVEHGELVEPAGDGQGEGEAVTQPAKVMRIGSMVKQLLDEVRAAPLDDRSRGRLAEIYERSVTELSGALSPELQDELRSLALPFDDGTPSDAELRVAQAQLVGWLEGLFHGIQATLFAQQIAARQQLEQMRQLPPGEQRPPGTYL